MAQQKNIGAGVSGAIGGGLVGSFGTAILVTIIAGDKIKGKPFMAIFIIGGILGTMAGYNYGVKQPMEV